MTNFFSVDVVDGLMFLTLEDDVDIFNFFAGLGFGECLDEEDFVLFAIFFLIGFSAVTEFGFSVLSGVTFDLIDGLLLDLSSLDVTRSMTSILLLIDRTLSLLSMATCATRNNTNQNIFFHVYS